MTVWHKQWFPCDLSHMYQKVQMLRRKEGSGDENFPWARELELGGMGGGCAQLRMRENIATVKQKVQEHKVGAGLIFICSYCLVFCCETFLLWFMLTLNSELFLLQPPESCDYRCVPDTCCFQILTESGLGSSNLTLVYVHGRDCCMWWQLLLTLCLCRLSGSPLCCQRSLTLLLTSPNSPCIPGTSLFLWPVWIYCSVVDRLMSHSDCTLIFAVLGYHFCYYHFLARVLAISAYYFLETLLALAVFVACAGLTQRLACLCIETMWKFVRFSLYFTGPPPQSYLLGGITYS